MITLSFYIYLYFTGSAFLSLSPLQITALSVVSGRLWVGTGSGAIFSVPLSLSECFLPLVLNYETFAILMYIVLFCVFLAGSESCSIPYCSLASAQLCYHGHRQAVKFIISAPGSKQILFTFSESRWKTSIDNSIGKNF